MPVIALILSACGGGDGSLADNAEPTVSASSATQTAADASAPAVDASEVPSVQAASGDAAVLPDDLTATPDTVDLKVAQAS